MVKRIAMLFGGVFLFIGVIGLFMTDTGMKMGIDSAARPLLGLFPVNLLHNLVHIAFGVWGLLAARTFAGARTYCQLGGVIYLVLAVCGLFIPTTFGFIPIGGNNIWLHAALGVVLAGAGFTAKEEATSASPATA